MATGLLESMDYKRGGLLERTHCTEISDRDIRRITSKLLYWDEKYGLFHLTYIPDVHDIQYCHMNKPSMQVIYNSLIWYIELIQRDTNKY